MYISVVETADGNKERYGVKKAPEVIEERKMKLIACPRCIALIHEATVFIVTFANNTPQPSTYIT